MQTWSEPWTGFRRTFGEFGDNWSVFVE